MGAPVTTDRRTMLKGVGLAGALAATPAAAATMGHGLGSAGATWLVYDSRIPESAHFAAQHSAQQRIDLATAGDWANIRAGGPAAGAVEGLTRWSDWVALRGAFEEQGLRLADERQSPAPMSGRDHLFRWAMRPR